LVDYYCSGTLSTTYLFYLLAFSILMGSSTKHCSCCAPTSWSLSIHIDSLRLDRSGIGEKLPSVDRNNAAAINVRETADTSHLVGAVGLQVSCHLQVGNGLALSLESKPPTCLRPSRGKRHTYQLRLALALRELSSSIAIAHRLDFTSLARGNLTPKWSLKLLMMTCLPGNTNGIFRWRRQRSSLARL
jgi:hypothetical protein